MCKPRGYVNQYTKLPQRNLQPKTQHRARDPPPSKSHGALAVEMKFQGQQLPKFSLVSLGSARSRENKGVPFPLSFFGSLSYAFGSGGVGGRSTTVDDPPPSLWVVPPRPPPPELPDAPSAPPWSCPWAFPCG